MCPSFSSRNSPDCLQVNPIAFCQLATVEQPLVEEGANSENFRFEELREVLSRSSNLAVMSYHVGHVLSVVTGIQVGGVAAPSDVAAMTNKDGAGQTTLRQIGAQQEGDAVSKPHLWFITKSQATPDLPVSVAPGAALPEPVFGRATRRNVLPEPVSKGAGRTAGLRAIVADLRRPAPEHRATRQTAALDASRVEGHRGGPSRGVNAPARSRTARALLIVWLAHQCCGNRWWQSGLQSRVCSPARE